MCWINIVATAVLTPMPTLSCTLKLHQHVAPETHLLVSLRSICATLLLKQLYGFVSHCLHYGQMRCGGRIELWYVTKVFGQLLDPCLNINSNTIIKVVEMFAWFAFTGRSGKFRYSISACEQHSVQLIIFTILVYIHCSSTNFRPSHCIAFLLN